MNLSNIDDLAKKLSDFKRLSLNDHRIPNAVFRTIAEIEVSIEKEQNRLRLINALDELQCLIHEQQRKSIETVRILSNIGRRWEV